MTGGTPVGCVVGSIINISLFLKSLLRPLL